MSKWQLLQALFEAAYQSENPAHEIRNLLRENFPMTESRHLDALKHFCEPREGELPGMVYGMIWEAWNQFRAEQEAV
jgi:hypothetical protein